MSYKGKSFWPDAYPLRCNTLEESRKLLSGKSRGIPPFVFDGSKTLENPEYRDAIYELAIVKTEDK